MELFGQVNTWTPTFVFDQNQSKNTAQKPDDELPASWKPNPPPELDEDIWIKGRVILVKNPAALVGLDADEIDDLVAGLTEDVGKKTFLFDDTTFNDYPDDVAFYDGISPVPTLDRNWVYLPGRTFLDIPGDTLVFNNNGSADRGDWGGFLADAAGTPISLEQYKDWAFLLEMQDVYDDAGREEVYIINLSNPPPPPPVPEPITMLGVLVGVGSLAGYIKRRRKA